MINRQEQIFWKEMQQSLINEPVPMNNKASDIASVEIQRKSQLDFLLQSEDWQNLTNSGERSPLHIIIRTNPRLFYDFFKIKGIDHDKWHSLDNKGNSLLDCYLMSLLRYSENPQLCNNYDYWDSDFFEKLLNCSINKNNSMFDMIDMLSEIPESTNKKYKDFFCSVLRKQKNVLNALFEKEDNMSSVQSIVMNKIDIMLYVGKPLKIKSGRYTGEVIETLYKGKYPDNKKMQMLFLYLSFYPDNRYLIEDYLTQGKDLEKIKKSVNRIKRSKEINSFPMTSVFIEKSILKQIDIKASGFVKNSRI